MTINWCNISKMKQKNSTRKPPRCILHKNNSGICSPYSLRYKSMGAGTYSKLESLPPVSTLYISTKFSSTAFWVILFTHSRARTHHNIHAHARAHTQTHTHNHAHARTHTHHNRKTERQTNCTQPTTITPGPFPTAVLKMIQNRNLIHKTQSQCYKVQ